MRIPLIFLLTLLLAGAGFVVPHALAEENQIVFSLEPSTANPRNSEGSFVRLKSGRILFYYSQFYNGSADGSPARIAGIHSEDDGRTWSQPETIVENTTAGNVMSVSLLRLASGKIAFFYIIKNSWLDARPYVRFSTDEAATWSEPKLVVPAPGYFVLNNDRVVQLSSGRIIVPVAFHRSKVADPQSSKAFDSRGIAMWYYSDDEGQTWQESATWWALPLATGSGLQEPGVVELANGQLFTWARTNTGAQWGFSSTDQGRTWTAPERTAMLSPTSPASIKRLPHSPNLLALYNDHSGRFPFPKAKRTPLVAAISTDDGKTWPAARPLEDDPDGWYCYTAIYYLDDAVLLAYCAGDSKIGGLNRLRMRRISYDWLPKP